MKDSDKQDLVERIIENLLINAENKKVATCWGEPALLLCDVINIINNVAETDYKRYWAYGCSVKYGESKPHNINPNCEICKKYFAKHEDKQGCLGVINNNKEEPCEKFISILER